MYQWNRNELLRRLNFHITRVYTCSVLSGLFGVLCIVLISIFFKQGSGFFSTILVGFLYINYRRVVNAAKVNIAVIYINKRSQCSKLAFFKHCEDGRVKCSLGYIDLEGVQRMIDRKAIDRNLNGRSI